MEATGEELPKYGGHTKEVETQRGRNSFISSRKTRYGKTEEVEIWRPRERTEEAKIQRPREEANSKRPKPRSEKPGTSFYLEIVGRPKYGGDERRPERPKYGGHKRRPERPKPIWGVRNLVRKNSVQCHPETEGEKAKLYNLPNHTKDEMENKSSERIRATEPEGRQLRSHRVVENRQLETIKRGEKGGVGIIVRKRLPGKIDRKSSRSRKALTNTTVGSKDKTTEIPSLRWEKVGASEYRS